MGRRGIRGLKTKVGRECSISRGGGQIAQWRYTDQGSPRKKSQCYKWGCSSGGGAARAVRAAKSFEFGKGE